MPTQYAPDSDFGAWGLDATTAKFGMQLGHSAVAAGQQYVQKNVRSNDVSLEFHFF